MMNEGVAQGTTSPPARLDVAKWVHNAMLEMKGKGNIIQNTWKMHEYELFVVNTREQDVGRNNDGAEGAL
jgi:hypothetical protein